MFTLSRITGQGEIQLEWKAINPDSQPYDFTTKKKKKKDNYQLSGLSRNFLQLLHIFTLSLQSSLVESKFAVFSSELHSADPSRDRGVALGCTASLAGRKHCFYVTRAGDTTWRCGDKYISNYVLKHTLLWAEPETFHHHRFWFRIK